MSSVILGPTWNLITYGGILAKPPAEAVPPEVIEAMLKTSSIWAPQPDIKDWLRWSPFFTEYNVLRLEQLIPGKQYYVAVEHPIMWDFDWTKPATPTFVDLTMAPYNGWNQIVYFGKTLPCAEAVTPTVLAAMGNPLECIWHQRKRWCPAMSFPPDIQLSELVKGERYFLHVNSAVRWEFPQ